MEVLLGLLTVAPMSGYDLGQAIRVSVGHFWNESYGQIYPNLKKLAAGGFVTAKTEKQKGKPDRKIYSITPKGRMRLTNWLAVEPRPEIPRNELLLKLFFGVQASPQTLIGYVERMAKRESSILDELKRVEREEITPLAHYPDAVYWKMAARFGQLELEAHLRWTKETLATLHRIEGNRRKPSLTGKEKQHARR
ncbi:MAG: PadR family transcriptional regulator [Terracidiphilus sp.]|jgi:DNA-binding PadR family transcriptional regulator